MSIFEKQPRTIKKLLFKKKKMCTFVNARLIGYMALSLSRASREA